MSSLKQLPQQLSKEQLRDKRAVAKAGKAVKAATPAKRDEAMKRFVAVVHERASRPETIDEIITRERAAMPKAARADAIRAGKSPDDAEAAAIRALWQLPEEKSRERVKRMVDEFAKYQDYAIDLSGLPRVGDAPEPPPEKIAATTAPAASVKTYLVGDVLKMADVSDATLNKYARLADVTPPERGKRNHRYTEDEVRRIFQKMIDGNGDQTMKKNCRVALAAMENPN
jgi:hypothetical protein